ncbi:dihydrodipicolinate synthase family protein [Numidum massiliense]|uniref:dihydrodipicolinate synthase family protein n=1 Tax=Numidum massiliense TaxID=1522315 RepID=UPI0006D5AB91|nr:hypothetical protein [Numidum massiliense]
MKGLRSDLLQALHEGVVIPAHPLALHEDRTLDERRQRALTRYYMASGAGGVAVGVHTTQFEIRDPGIGLFEPVLRLAAETIDDAQLERPFIRVAGICGPTEQALAEAKIAADLGYHLGLVSMGGLADWTEAALLERLEKIADVIPIFGFYLQPSVGGRRLSYEFWKAFADIPNVMAIKMAPFNRYQTLDVVRAVCESSRRDEIALYTGNDDNIVADLLTTYRFDVGGETVEKRIVGGLLGHWAVWTEKAVQLLEEIKRVRDDQTTDGRTADVHVADARTAHRCAADTRTADSRDVDVRELLLRGIEVTDANAAFFDPAHDFAGCIPGIHEVLRRQGLLEGLWCLNRDEQLSEGQLEEIDRVYRAYPHLNDDAFVAKHLSEWLA